jgi:hypothetical protein
MQKPARSAGATAEIWQLSVERDLMDKNRNLP